MTSHPREMHRTISHRLPLLPLQRSFHPRLFQRTVERTPHHPRQREEAPLIQVWRSGRRRRCSERKRLGNRARSRKIGADGVAVVVVRVGGRLGWCSGGSWDHVGLRGLTRSNEASFACSRTMWTLSGSLRWVEDVLLEDKQRDKRSVRTKRRGATGRAELTSLPSWSLPASLVPPPLPALLAAALALFLLLPLLLGAPGR